MKVGKHIIILVMSVPFFSAYAVDSVPNFSECHLSNPLYSTCAQGYCYTGKDLYCDFSTSNECEFRFEKSLGVTYWFKIKKGQNFLFPKKLEKLSYAIEVSRRIDPYANVDDFPQGSFAGHEIPDPEIVLSEDLDLKPDEPQVLVLRNSAERNREGKDLSPAVDNERWNLLNELSFIDNSIIRCQ